MSTTPEPRTGPADPRFRAQLRALARTLNQSSGRMPLFLLGGAILAVIVATAVAQVALNAWNKPFYDAIERKDFPEFLHQITVFLMIAGTLLVLNVSQTGLNQLIRLKLREIVTCDLIGNWMSGRRAARIGRAGQIGVNPDQRIHADAHHLAEVTTDLGVGLVQSSVLLVSFIGVLWVLSESILLPIGPKGEGTIPGYLVWAALLYAISGSWLSWRIGRPLVRLEANRYGREADLRVALVQGADQGEGIALINGERDARRQLGMDLERVLAIGRRIVLARVPLTGVTAGYGWVALVFPFLVAAPGYFARSLSFGELMMVVGAFIQVQQALRWFVDNTGAIADWRATLMRVMVFRSALLRLDDPDGGPSQVERQLHPEGRLAFHDFSVSTWRERLDLAEPDLEIAPGERVLLIGKPGPGKTTLFLAMAGLWDRGEGRIALPPSREMMFLSQRPFVPAGSLRRALTCSNGEHPCSDLELQRALARVGLGQYLSALDMEERWDRDLSVGEQERLGYARLLLNRPKWLVADDVLDPLDDANRAIILSILTEDLAGTAVVNIGTDALPDGFYARVVRINATPTEERAAGETVRPRALEPSERGAA